MFNQSMASIDQNFLGSSNRIDIKGLLRVAKQETDEMNKTMNKKHSLLNDMMQDSDNNQEINEMELFITNNRDDDQNSVINNLFDVAHVNGDDEIDKLNQTYQSHLS